MGAALAGVADAAISLFLVAVEDPMLRAGHRQVSRAKAVESATAALVEIPNVMDGLFRGHVELAIRRQRASTAYDGGPGRLPTRDRLRRPRRVHAAHPGT